jgi:hypothetical protein
MSSVQPVPCFESTTGCKIATGYRQGIGSVFSKEDAQQEIVGKCQDSPRMYVKKSWHFYAVIPLLSKGPNNAQPISKNPPINVEESRSRPSVIRP